MGSLKMITGIGQKADPDMLQNFAPASKNFLSHIVTAVKLLFQDTDEHGQTRICQKKKSVFMTAYDDIVTPLVDIFLTNQKELPCLSMPLRCGASHSGLKSVFRVVCHEINAFGRIISIFS